MCLLSYLMYRVSQKRFEVKCLANSINFTPDRGFYFKITAERKKNFNWSMTVGAIIRTSRDFADSQLPDRHPKKPMLFNFTRFHGSEYSLCNSSFVKQSCNYVRFVSLIIREFLKMTFRNQVGQVFPEIREQNLAHQNAEQSNDYLAQPIRHEETSPVIQVEANSLS